MTSTAMPPSSEENSASRSQVVRVFGEPRFHTDGDLQALAFAADGTIWSVEDPGELRQWEPRTGQVVQGHFLSDVETLWAFSPDARLLASASDDLSLWDTATGKQRATIAQPSWVTTVAFRPDGTMVATGHDDGMVRLWDTTSRQLLREFKEHTLPVSTLAFSPDGTRLASAGEDRLIQLWDTNTGQALAKLHGHTDRIPALAWHPKGHRLVSAGWDTTARVWDTAADEPVILLNSHADQVTALAFSPDGQMLACADSADTIHIWHTVSWKTLQILNVPGAEVHCLAFSPDGRQLVSGGADRVIHLWDPQHGTLLSGSDAAARHAIGIADSKQGQRLASTCGTGLRVWDVASGQAILTPEVPGILSTACSPDGQWIAGGGTDEKTRVQLWDAAAGRLHSAMSGQRGAATNLAMAANSSLLASASASDGTVWLWNVATGEPALLIIEAADGCTVEALAFHPQGRLLACGGIDWMATGGSDGAICIWDITQPAKVGIFEQGTTSLAFHPSGKWLAAASLDEVIYLWDIETQQLVAELGGQKDGINAIAFSPDGRYLTSGSEDRTVRLWDFETREPIALEELDTPIKALCFSPDGRFLFTGNGNTTCYQLEVARLLEE